MTNDERRDLIAKTAAGMALVAPGGRLSFPREDFLAALRERLPGVEVTWRDLARIRAKAFQLYGVSIKWNNRPASAVKLIAQPIETVITTVKESPK